MALLAFGARVASTEVSLGDGTSLLDRADLIVRAGRPHSTPSAAAPAAPCARRPPSATAKQADDQQGAAEFQAGMRHEREPSNEAWRDSSGGSGGVARLSTLRHEPSASFASCFSQRRAWRFDIGRRRAAMADAALHRLVDAEHGEDSLA